MARVLARRHRRGLARQGRDRPGHPHRAGADRRRRARRRARPRPHGPGDDGRAARTRASPRAACRCRIAASRCATSAPRRARSTSPPPPSGSASPEDALAVEDGTIVGPGNARTSYWELADEVSLDRDATCRAAPKPAAARRIAGTSAARLDIPDKVFGQPRFIHDLSLPGMLHGRVLRPDAPRAPLTALDDAAARRVPGVIAVVRDGAFAGVVAETEHAAEAALARLRAGAGWGEGETLPEGRARGVAQEPAGRDQGRRRPRLPCPPHARPDPAARLHAAVHRPCLDRAVLRHRAVERRRACRSGRIRRASTICAPTSRSCWRCRRSGSSSSTSRAPAATATTAPTTSRSTPCCSPARRKAGRCACSGRARTSLPGRPSAPRWRSRSRPISTRAGEIVGWRHDDLEQRPRRAARPQR